LIFWLILIYLEYAFLSVREKSDGIIPIQHGLF
jgi:hypothetical protein